MAAYFTCEYMHSLSRESFPNICVTDTVLIFTVAGHMHMNSMCSTDNYSALMEKVDVGNGPGKTLLISSYCLFITMLWMSIILLLSFIYSFYAAFFLILTYSSFSFCLPIVFPTLTLTRFSVSELLPSSLQHHTWAAWSLPAVYVLSLLEHLKISLLGDVIVRCWEVCYFHNFIWLAFGCLVSSSHALSTAQLLKGNTELDPRCWLRFAVGGGILLTESSGTEEMILFALVIQNQKWENSLRWPSDNQFWLSKLLEILCFSVCLLGSTFSLAAVAQLVWVFW